MPKRVMLPYPSDLVLAIFRDTPYENNVKHLSEDQLKGVEEVLDSIEEAPVLRMYYKDGLTYSAIGAIIGKSTERVRQIVHRGIRRIMWSPMAKGMIVEGFDAYRERIERERAERAKNIKEVVVTPKERAIEDLVLSTRSYNCLRRDGFKTVGEVATMTRKELLKVRNLGVTCADEIEHELQRFLSEEQDIIRRVS